MSPPDFAPEAYRPELTGYCYRMLGSAADADDAVQETMLRAFRGLDGFEGRASLRSWLYRIATNVCLDLAARRRRREQPLDLGPPGSAAAPLPDPEPARAWLEPLPDAAFLAGDLGPELRLHLRQHTRLALVAALQRLPPRQRAVLLLREVLGLPAAEVADLLGASVPAVRSALQRARATLDARPPAPGDPLDPLDGAQQALLARYVDAFERYDMAALSQVLHEDATLSMPPYALWLRGRAEIEAFLQGHGVGCRHSTLVPTAACGAPAFGQYHATPEGRRPWSLIVLDLRGGRIQGICHLLDVDAIFPRFGLPLALPPA